MRIARIVQYFQPRFGYADYYLMTAFKKLGHEVCIITSDRCSPGVTLFDNTINRKVGFGKSVEYGLPVYRLSTLFEVDGLIINLVGMKKVLEDFKPDVVHSNDLFYPLTLSAVHCKRKFGYKLFVDSITGTFNPAGPRALGFKMYKWLFARYLRKSVNEFFAVCYGSKRWLSRNFSIPHNSIKVVPLGADKDLFAPNAEVRRIMRDNLGSTNAEVVVIHTGKIIPSKDIDTLIKSMALVTLNSSKKVKLLIIGSGPQRYSTYLEILVKVKKIQENVIFIPTVDRNQLPNYYNAADIAIWPGSPSISIIEAMSTGLPIIISGYPNRREDAYDTTHLLEYRNGLSFPIGDHAALAACIEKLINNKSLLREMGRKSRKLVENKLNWDCTATKYLESYRG